MEKKSIIWNGEEYIVDFETSTIYKENIIDYGEKLLPVDSRIGNYRFKEFRGNLYFTDGNSYYKIQDNSVLEINRQEYLTIQKYVFIDKKNPSTSKMVMNYIISILTGTIFYQKYNLKFSISVDSSTLIASFRKNLSPTIEVQLKNITMEIVNALPLSIKKQELGNKIKKLYDNMFKESEDYFNNLIELIYTEKKEKFDCIADDIIRNRETTKQIGIIYSQDELKNYDEIIEQKGKSK